METSSSSGSPSRHNQLDASRQETEALALVSQLRREILDALPNEGASGGGSGTADEDTHVRRLLKSCSACRAAKGAFPLERVFPAAQSVLEQKADQTWIPG